MLYTFGKNHALHQACAETIGKPRLQTLRKMDMKLFDLNKQ